MTGECKSIDIQIVFQIEKKTKTMIKSAKAIQYNNNNKIIK